MPALRVLQSKREYNNNGNAVTERLRVRIHPDDIKWTQWTKSAKKQPEGVRFC